MFVVTLTYVKPLAEIDALIPAHMAWLERQYAAGHFLASGRRVPRVGGVILAQGVSRDALEAMLAEERGMADWLLHHQPTIVGQFLHRADLPGVEAGK